MRIIRVCAGIGDNIWLLQKLVNAGEKFRFMLAGDEPKRGKQIFDLLPQVSESAEYGPFDSLYAINRSLHVKKPTWAEMKPDQDFCLSANTHLEHGVRLEQFLPDLPTSFRLEWDTARYAGTAEAELSAGAAGAKIVGLYGSSYSTLRHWNFWKAPEWTDLARRILVVAPKTVFVVVGASFDTDLAADLTRSLSAAGIRHLMVVGRELGLVVEYMRRMAYFFAFPSGLGILSASIACPTMMFYPPHLAPMTNAWANPAAIADKAYFGRLFCDTATAFNLAVNECGLARRLA